MKTQEGLMQAMRANLRQGRSFAQSIIECIDELDSEGDEFLTVEKLAIGKEDGINPDAMHEMACSLMYRMVAFRTYLAALTTDDYSAGVARACMAEVRTKH